MSKATLQRRPLVKKILDGADDNLLVIAGLGSSNWDITKAGDRPSTCRCGAPWARRSAWGWASPWRSPTSGCW